MLIQDWYRVNVGPGGISLDVAPPGGAAWRELVHWDQIERVCFEAAGDPWESDTWYVFIRGRAESFAIPSEAAGAGDLLGALLDRGLFDADLAIQAAGASGPLFCWPPHLQ